MSLPAEPVPPKRQAILALSVAATFLAILSTNVVNVALPQLMRAFGATVAQAEWVVTAYMITFALALPISGWLADRYGRPRTFFAALGVFIAGALVAAAAPSLPALVLGRIVQAAGASALGPTAMGLIHEYFEPHERGRALGLWSAGATLGPALGPTVGGLLVESVGWRAIFLLYVPLGLLVLAFAAKLLPRGRRAAHANPFDRRGFHGSMLLSGGLLAAIQGVSHAAWASAGVGAVALGCAALLLRAPRARGGAAFLDFTLLERPAFAAALALSATRSFALFGSIFLLPLYMQRVGGL
ncbi:MAG: MFS transporter, partial [Myxococcales bacterium]